MSEYVMSSLFLKIMVAAFIDNLKKLFSAIIPCPHTGNFLCNLREAANEIFRERKNKNREFLLFYNIWQ